MRVVQFGTLQESIIAREPQAIAGARKLPIVRGRHDPDAVAGLFTARLLAIEADVAVGVGPLLDADQQREVAVAEIGHDEDLVALEAGIRAAELPGPASGRCPEPPVLAGVTRRDDEVACACKVAWRSVLKEFAVLAVRIGLLVDLRRIRFSKGRIALRLYQPCARRVYQPGASVTTQRIIGGPGESLSVRLLRNVREIRGGGQAASVRKVRGK